MKTYQLFVIPGDGIGPEITEAALQVVQAVEAKLGTFRMVIHNEEAGAGYFEKSGENISEETVRRLVSDADAILKGPAGLPTVRLKNGTEAGIIGGVLRPRLEAFANVRPVRLLPGINAPVKFALGEIDYVIVRENTEGLYASREGGVRNHWAAADTLLMTRNGVERVVRFAFDLARKRKGAPIDGVRRVTCVDKSNLLKSMAFFRDIFKEVAGEYPDVESDFLYSDAAGQALVQDPSRFSVLVMENFIGDMLSDVGGGTVGGIGMCPSGNIGTRRAYFEPIHGSAPSIAGQDKANPIAHILSAAMLLEWLGESEAASLIEGAVDAALAEQQLAITGQGSPADGTKAATAAIVASL